jgi:type IV pilus assembly protein PilM
MALFSKASKKMLAIDIGSSAVKLLELSRTPEKNGFRYTVDSFAMAPLPDGAVDSKKIVNAQLVGQIIQDIVKQSSSSAKRSVSAVSGGSVISRVIQMPNGLTESEMESTIEVEAERYLPQRIDEVRFDFDVLGETRNNPDSVDVLLVAARGDVVDDIILSLETANLQPEIIDAEPYAIEHCYQMLVQEDEKASIAIVDIGASTMDVHVLGAGDIKHTREYSIGGKQLTADIQRHYGLDFTEAEKKKCEGGLPDDYIETILQPFVQRLAQDMRGALQIYQASDEGGNISMIYLVGGCANLPGVGDLVQNLIGVPVRTLDPFADMRFGKNVNLNRLREMAPSLVVACGLALRRFD